MVTSYVLRSIAVSPPPGCFGEALKVRWHTVMEAAGMNGCQGTPWSEELDDKDSMERLGGEYDLESRGSSFFLHICSRRQHINSKKHLQMWYYACLKGVVFLA